MSQEFQTVRNFPLSQLLGTQISGNKISMSSLDYPLVSGYRHIRATPSMSEGSGYTSTQIRRIDNFIERFANSAEARERSAERMNSTIASDEISERIAQLWLSEHNAHTLRELGREHSAEFGINSSRSAQILDFSV